MTIVTWLIKEEYQDLFQSQLQSLQVFPCVLSAKTHHTHTVYLTIEWIELSACLSSAKCKVWLK